MDQEVNARRSSFEVPDDLACLLVNPRRVWMIGSTCEVDATAAQLNKKEHIHRLQKESFHREKITCQNLVFVVGHEVAPAWGMSSFGRWRDPVSSQNVGDCFVANLDAQFGEFPRNLVVAPVSIFAGQSRNEPFNFLVGAGTTTLSM